MSFSHASEFQYFMAAALIIFFLGLKDDILALSPFKKMAGQFFAAFLIIFKGDLQLTNMYGFLGFNELSGFGSISLTFFTILVIINSFNLIDGVDGLAGTLGLLVTTILGIYFLEMGLFEYAIFSFSLAGSLIAFLYFNFQPAKIFMGDTGSLTIGLICSILVIKFINVGTGNFSIPVVSAPALGFSMLAIPLLDTLRVFSIRLSRGKSPFKPDRNHIHHIMLDRGFNPTGVTLCLLAISIITIALTYLGQNLGSTVLITLMGVGYFGFILLLSKLPGKTTIAKPPISVQSVKRTWIEKPELAEEVIAE
jgi:UDP-N-acetylmuramyl pentapeptide phosphotransferase/UDP-N-acetylglucosamine-1-phosphate transferase